MIRPFLLCCLVFVARHTGAAEPQVDGVIQPLPAAAQVLVPAAGSIPGANGTFFRSDISVWNLRDVPQAVELQWVPHAGTAAFAPVQAIIPAHGALRSEDFVHDIWGQSALGAIIVTGLAQDATSDTGARLHVTSRIWTPQGFTTGTTSQSLPAIPTGAINAGTVTIFGLRRDDRYRANVGIVNLDPSNEQTFDVDLGQNRLSQPPEVYSVTVPALSMRQIALNAPLQQPFILVRVSNITGVAARSSRWLAYGSSIDNSTGDAWSEVGAPDSAD